MAEHGAVIDKIYYCPHHVEGTIEEYKKDCNWRKPNPGMIEEAARELVIDLDNSFIIGDKISDLEAGHRAGCKTIFLANETHPNKEPEIPLSDHIATDLYEAVQWLIQFGRHKK